MSKKFGICQYDINGKHYALDDENELLKFETPEQAILFLARKNIPVEIINNLSIEKLTELELNDSYISENGVVV